MNATPPAPAVARRLAQLDSLCAERDALLDELFQVAGVAPAARARCDVLALFGQVAAFVDRTDFAAATGDARSWLHNRLGLYLAEWFIARHGGALAVQGMPGAPFYLHFVVAGMAPPVAHGACVAPFAIAQDAIHGPALTGLADMVGAAEAALARGAAGPASAQT